MIEKMVEQAEMIGEAIETYYDLDYFEAKSTALTMMHRGLVSSQDLFTDAVIKVRRAMVE